MSMLFVLIPLAIGLLGVAVWAFFWAVRSGQFDDLDSPAVRILLDDEESGAGAGSARVEPGRDDAESGTRVRDGHGDDRRDA